MHAFRGVDKCGVCDYNPVVATRNKKRGGDDLLSRASALLRNTVTIEDVLAKLGARDKANVERHLVAADTESDSSHGKLWRRLVRTLASLAPHSVATIGQQAATFNIADGRYRQQVFALEDPRDNTLVVYIEDVLETALQAGLIEPAPAGSFSFPIRGEPGHALHIEQLTAQNTPNPAAAYKHMLGWNRKALRVILPTNAAVEEAIALEQLAALSALRWAGKEQDTPPQPVPAK